MLFVGLASLPLAGCAPQCAPNPEPSAYWAGNARMFAESPDGHVVGVRCHNCYEDGEESGDANLESTLVRVHDAQGTGADILEVDVIKQDSSWFVGHEDDGAATGARFADLLTDPRILDGDQTLFVEIKEDDPAEPGHAELLDAIEASGIAANGRAVVISALSERAAALREVAGLLRDEPERFPYLRTTLMFLKGEVDDPAVLASSANDAVEAGIHGLDFYWNSAGTCDQIALTRELGLGVGVGVFEDDDDGSLCRTFRDVVDVVTTDSSHSGCHDAIEAQ